MDAFLRRVVAQREAEQMRDLRNERYRRGGGVYDGGRPASAPPPADPNKDLSPPKFLVHGETVQFIPETPQQFRERLIPANVRALIDKGPALQQLPR